VNGDGLAEDVAVADLQAGSDPKQIRNATSNANDSYDATMRSYTVAGVGTGVANPPSVRVTDVSGNPVSGVAVTFAVTAGAGTISPTSPMTTDATGIATLTSWTLGPSVGGNTVNASAALVAATVNFNATGTFHVASIAGGSGHTCALTVDGVAFCWGDNTWGQLGDNSNNQRLNPVTVPGRPGSRRCARTPAWRPGPESRRSSRRSRR